MAHKNAKKYPVSTRLNETDTSWKYRPFAFDSEIRAFNTWAGLAKKVLIDGINVSAYQSKNPQIIETTVSITRRLTGPSPKSFNFLIFTRALAVFFNFPPDLYLTVDSITAVIFNQLWRLYFNFWRRLR